ncbi:hypothetical protein ACJZ2D_006726 [Fusarium nematophilum]
MSEDLVMSTTPAAGVRVLTFNRPSKRNALSQELITIFLEHLQEASLDHGVESLSSQVAGLAFAVNRPNPLHPLPTGCSGADISEISTLDAEAARGRRYLADLCTGMRAVRKPMIAAVEGMALGGGFEVALMCDLIFTARGSRFGLPEVTIGLLPGAGGTQRLTNAVGKFKMILLGKPILADEARSAGLVADLFEPGKVIEKVLETASGLAALSPTALSLSKEAICRSDDLGCDEEFERSLYYFAFGIPDKDEGVKAFLEKRAPQWKSR